MTTLRKIGQELKRGETWIEGRVSHTRWPDEPHYYVIIRGRLQEIVHVDVDVRPKWKKYIQEAIASIE